MPQIIDNKIYHAGQKIGWIDNKHIKPTDSNNPLGYYDEIYIYNHDGRKVAYIHENELFFENGQPPVSLQHINEEVEGSYPIIVKCAVHTLLDTHI